MALTRSSSQPRNQVHDLTQVILCLDICSQSQFTLVQAVQGGKTYMATGGCFEGHSGMGLFSIAEFLLAKLHTSYPHKDLVGQIDHSARGGDIFWFNFLSLTVFLTTSAAGVHSVRRTPVTVLPFKNKW